MFGGIDLGRLLNGTVVQPEDNVMVIVEARGGDGDGFIGVMGENGQGASGIESETSNGSGIDIMLVEDSLNGIADASPYVICRLFLHHRSAKCG